MKDTNIITRQLLDYRLGKSKSPELTNALLERFLTAEPLYLIFDIQDGQPREAVVTNSELAVFLKRETAEARSGAMLSGASRAVVEMGAQKTQTIIS